MLPACSSPPAATRRTIRARNATSQPGRNNWNRRASMADITAPAYRIIPIIPVLKPGAMEGTKSFVASDKINEAIGFPGHLVDDWHDRAIARMGELLSKYRSLRVYMDARLHRGACSDKCH